MYVKMASSHRLLVASFGSHPHCTFPLCDRWGCYCSTRTLCSVFILRYRIRSRFTQRATRNDAFTVTFLRVQEQEMRVFFLFHLRTALRWRSTADPKDDTDFNSIGQ